MRTLEIYEADEAVRVIEIGIVTAASVPGWYSGTGAPDDDMTVAVGSLYLDLSTNTIYKKEVD